MKEDWRKLFQNGGLQQVSTALALYRLFDDAKSRFSGLFWSKQATLR